MTTQLISLSELVRILTHKQNTGEITVNLSYRQGYELGLMEAVEVAKALLLTQIPSTDPTPACEQGLKYQIDDLRSQCDNRFTIIDNVILDVQDRLNDLESNSCGDSVTSPPSEEKEKKGCCDECGTKTIDHCPQCGAPQCCPKCCDEATAEYRKNKEIGKCHTPPAEKGSEGVAVDPAQANTPNFEETPSKTDPAL